MFIFQDVGCLSFIKLSLSNAMTDIEYSLSYYLCGVCVCVYVFDVVVKDSLSMLAESIDCAMAC